MADCTFNGLGSRGFLLGQRKGTRDWTLHTSLRGGRSRSATLLSSRLDGGNGLLGGLRTWLHCGLCVRSWLALVALAAPRSSRVETMQVSRGFAWVGLHGLGLS